MLEDEAARSLAVDCETDSVAAVGIGRVLDVVSEDVAGALLWDAELCVWLAFGEAVSRVELVTQTRKMK